jgi:hypothetical protein
MGQHGQANALAPEDNGSERLVDPLPAWCRQSSITEWSANLVQTAGRITVQDVLVMAHADMRAASHCSACLVVRARLVELTTICICGAIGLTRRLAKALGVGKMVMIKLTAYGVYL